MAVGGASAALHRTGFVTAMTAPPDPAPPARAERDPEDRRGQSTASSTGAPGAFFLIDSIASLAPDLEA
jgi:hypothetical protein